MTRSAKPLNMRHDRWKANFYRENPMPPHHDEAQEIVQQGDPYTVGRAQGIQHDSHKVIVLGADRDHVILENGELLILDSTRLNLAVRLAVWRLHNPEPWQLATTAAAGEPETPGSPRPLANVHE